MNPASRTTAAATAVVLATAGTLLTAAAPASAATTCTSPVYKRQFYANTTFSGTPKKTDCDSAIDQNWGTGAPASGLPSNYFGVRWTVTRDFGSGGPFALAASGLDGIRVYLDGVRRIDLWKNTSTTVSRTANVTIPSGKHTLRVDYVNWTGGAKVKFAYTPRTSATVDSVKPLAPAGVSVAYDKATSKAKLTWAKNKEMDLAGYRVYQRAEDSGVWRLVSGDVFNATSFTHALPPTGAVYYYELRAVDRAGNESAGSTDQLVTTVDRTPPETPVLTATDHPLLGVDLLWDNVDEGGLRFDTYRAASPTGEWTKIGAGMGGSGVLDGTAPFGKTSYYRVTATDPAGNSVQSDILAFARPLPKPYLDNAGTDADETGVELRWTMAKHAPTQYHVYRQERFGGSADWVRVVCEPSDISPADDPYARYACTDRSAVPRTDYWYRITSVGDDGTESEPSQVISAGLYDRTPPPAVTGLHHTSTEYGTVLEWDAGPAPDLASYRVWRATSARDTSTHELIATVPAGTTRYVDVQVPDGQDWVYFVDAMDTANNSLYTVSGSPADEVADVSVDELFLTPSYAPPNTAAWTLSGTADGTGKAALSWTCATGCAASGFHVHRWDRATEQYVRLTDEPLAADARGYTDPATPTATTSYYLVSAVAADGSEAFTGLAPVVVPPSGT
ncbi:PA14 domain-containing protein [Streptomyces sp. H51]|uniref:PA14 domain-containing protein n=1 Tax=Streptomyces sp. H51 TaxID=3111770 RepID=UPI002D78AD1E|nr:PA14 domain-containing protein [Streptomyces sp. H51]